jgi:AcrR family transcriptional regulator
MGRPPGARNVDHEQRRTELVDAVSAALMQLGAGASLRQLAESAGTHVTVLRHYFGDRSGLVRAVMARAHAQSAPYRAAASAPRAPDVTGAIATQLREIVMAWRRFGVGRLHVVGIGEGLGSGELGPAYVSEVLEPTLVPCEALLTALIERGDLDPIDVRAGALALVAPVVLALFHQDELGGRACRPLDVDAFVEEHARRWLAGWGR